MNKKGFTILELIMVIGIILILILVLNNVFYNKNKDFLYAESCVNKVYGDINNFIYSAITSRGLYINTGLIFPEKYIISITPSGNEYHLQYQDLIETGTYIRNQLTNDILKHNYCSTKNYTVILSGEDFDITINKASLQDKTAQTFKIENKFTGSTEIFLCYTGNICKEIANFLIDTRIQSINKKRCIRINDDGSNCLQRDQ